MALLVCCGGCVVGVLRSSVGGSCGDISPLEGCVIGRFGMPRCEGNELQQCMIEESFDVL